MSIKEALEEIKRLPKWYLIADSEGNISSTFNIARRIEEGTAKPDTIKWFFSQYGYEVNIKIEFVRHGKKDMVV